MLYITKKEEKERAQQFLESLTNQGLRVNTIPLYEVLAMYGKHLELHSGRPLRQEGEDLGKSLFGSHFRGGTGEVG